MPPSACNIANTRGRTPGARSPSERFLKFGSNVQAPSGKHFALSLGTLRTAETHQAYQSKAPRPEIRHQLLFTDHPVPEPCECDLCLMPGVRHPAPCPRAFCKRARRPLYAARHLAHDNKCEVSRTERQASTASYRVLRTTSDKHLLHFLV